MTIEYGAELSSCDADFSRFPVCAGLIRCAAREGMRVNRAAGLPSGDHVGSRQRVEDGIAPVGGQAGVMATSRTARPVSACTSAMVCSRGCLGGHVGHGGGLVTDQVAGLDDEGTREQGADSWCG
jgi:hypothetical protein